ncbi:nitroreductase family protein [Bacillaceae bacterium S4-13-56]
MNEPSRHYQILEALDIQDFSVFSFDPSFTISRGEIMQIIDSAIKSPTSWRNQSWKFLILDDSRQKRKLVQFLGNHLFVKDSSTIVVALVDQNSDIISNQFHDGVSEDDILRCSPTTLIYFLLGCIVKGYDTWSLRSFQRGKINEVL